MLDIFALTATKSLRCPFEWDAAGTCSFGLAINPINSIESANRQLEAALRSCRRLMGSRTATIRRLTSRTPSSWPTPTGVRFRHPHVTRRIDAILTGRKRKHERLHSSAEPSQSRGGQEYRSGGKATVKYVAIGGPSSRSTGGKPKKKKRISGGSADLVDGVRPSAATPDVSYFSVEAVSFLFFHSAFVFFSFFFTTHGPGLRTCEREGPPTVGGLDQLGFGDVVTGNGSTKYSGNQKKKKKKAGHPLPAVQTADQDGPQQCYEGSVMRTTATHRKRERDRDGPVVEIQPYEVGPQNTHTPTPTRKKTREREREGE